IVSVVTLVWGISPRQPSGKNIIRWLLKKRTNGSVRYCQYTSRYYYKGVLWSAGYFASSCGGAPISVIRQYIEQQQTPGQVENRALYPRPEGWGFTAHRIKSAI
ncbi:transposase, partial [Escherichia coli]